METRVIMQNSHNENIMEKVHKHMSAPTKCGNKDTEHLLPCSSVVGQSWHWEQSMHSLEKQLFLVSIAIWPLALGRALDSRSNTTRVGKFWGLALQIACCGQTTFWLHNSTQQTIFNGCDHPVATKHVFFFGTLVMIDVRKFADFRNLMSVIFCQGRQHLSCVWTHRKPLKHHKAREYHSE